MVVSALIEQLLPSHRGLARDGSLAVMDDAHVWQYHQHHDHHQQQQQQRQRQQHHPQHHPNLQSAHPHATYPPNAWGGAPPRIPATRQRRKRCRATKCLASLTADFDIVTDWVFYAHCRHEDKEYRRKREENPDEGDGGLPYLVPGWLLWLIFSVCVSGTVVWLTLATDGALASPLLRLLGYDKLSMGYLLFLGVIVEDIPQVILTFLVEDYFEENTEFNNYALLNVVASLYDTLIKLAEAFDERADVVETGMWCKESLWAHNKPVTCVVPIPYALDDDDGDSEDGDDQGNGSGWLHPLGGRAFPPSPGGPPGPSPSTTSWRSHSAHSMHLPVEHTTEYSSRRRNLFQEAQEIVSDTKLPRLTFLSASMDSTVRLWDTHATNKGPGKWREKCVRTYEGQHRLGISCVAYLGDATPAERGNIHRHRDHSLHSNEHDQSQGQHGTSPHPAPPPPPQQRDDIGIMLPPSPNPVDSRQSLNQTQSHGRPPLPTPPRALYKNNSLLDGPLQADSARSSSSERRRRDTYFLTGSYDGTAKLWNVRSGECLRTYAVPAESNVPRESVKVTSIAYFCATRTESASGPTTLPSSPSHARQFAVPPPTSVGASTSPNSGVPRDLFISGYESGKARLWDVWSGTCLAEFHGCGGTVHALCSLEDSRHFATASNDGTLRVWNTDGIIVESALGLTNRDATTSSLSLPTPPSNSANAKKSLPSRSQDLSQALIDGPATSGNSQKDHDPTPNSPPRIQNVCDQTLVGHTGAVTSAKCVVPGLVLLSGSEDRSARLWSIDTGACLRIFVGHTDAVTSVGVVDSVTFMTGSKDTTIKVWDGISASCVRTYTGHSGTVTSVSTTSQSGTFISASDDLTVKLWVFTAVVPSLTSIEGGTLNEVLGVEDGLCAAWDGEHYLT